MITEPGIVTKTQETTAWIKTTRSSACKVCEARGSCDTASRHREMHFQVDNTIGVRTGDHVIVGIETRSLLFLTFLLYVCPVLMLLAGAFAGNALAPFLDVNPSAAAAFLGFGLFIVTFFILHKKNNSISMQHRYRPFLVRKQAVVAANTCHR